MIQVRYNAKRLSALYSQRAFALNQEILEAEQTSAAAIKQEAQDLSSGPFREAYLRKAARKRGHGLYSQADPAPPGPAGVINEQTGRFKRGWVCKVYISRDGTTITLYNVSPYSRFMLGTARMIPRPIHQLIASRQRAARVLRLAQAKTRALRRQ